MLRCAREESLGEIPELLIAVTRGQQQPEKQLGRAWRLEVGSGPRAHRPNRVGSKSNPSDKLDTISRERFKAIKPANSSW